MDAPDRIVNSGTADVSILGDAKRSFDTAVQHLRAIMCSTNCSFLLEHGVYMRSTFESHFDLQWGVPNAAIAPAPHQVL